MSTSIATILHTDIQPDQASNLEMPNNIHAEQILLGAILHDNEVLVKVNDQLQAEDFYHPVHRKVYQQINQFVDRGIVATPVTLKNIFDTDPTLSELGGAKYLSELVSLGATCFNPVDFARTIRDLGLRRSLIQIARSVLDDAYKQNEPLPGMSQIEQAEQQLFNLATTGKFDNNFMPLGDSLNLAIERATHAHKNRDKLTGISTGFQDLDNYLNGFQNSDLLILAARPSMGKTALALNLATNACKHLIEHEAYYRELNNSQSQKSPSVGFFSLEMSAEQLALRILSTLSGVSSSRIRNGDLIDVDFEKIVSANRELQKYNFFIDDTPALTISALRTRARRLKRQNNLAILFVDYLQLLRSNSKQADNNRVQEISEITQGLKAIAKELNIPVVALSQLSRAVEQREDKHPQLSDLRESGSIEQDADIVMFIYRAEYYLMRKEPHEDSDKHAKWLAEMEQLKNVAEIIIAKHRNGPIGTPKLHYDSMTTKFSNYIERHGEYPLG